MSYYSLLYIFVTLNHILPDYLLFPFAIIYLWHKKVTLNKNVFLLLILIMCSGILNILIHYNYFSLSLFAHLIFLISVTVLIKDKEFKLDKFILLIKFIIIVNFVLLFTFFTCIGRDIFFHEAVKYYRFRSFYLEPSILALFTIFNFIMIYFYDSSKNRIWFLIFSFIVLLLTFSGSGFVVLLLIFIPISILRFNFKIKYFHITIAIATMIVVLLLSSMKSDGWLTQRFNKTITGNYDNSTSLRFFAPIEFISITVSDNLCNIFTGVGDPRKFIKQNFSKFKLFHLWTGDATYNINNGYVLIYGMGGVFFIILLFAYILLYFKINKLPILIFIILFPFFSGHFVSILFWFLLSFYNLDIKNRTSGVLNNE